MDSAPTIKVSFADVVDGRAYIRLSGSAKIKLAHMAGAPWSEKDPDAQLHDLQQEVLCRPEREKIVHGASRLGKSVLGGCEGIAEVMLPKSKLAVVAARYDHVAHEWQYIHKGLRNLFRNHGAAFVRLKFKHQQAYHEYDVETVWGSRGRGYSTDADEGAALLGQEFSRMVLGEGSHISQEILEKRALRALDGWLMKRTDGAEREGGYLSIYTTPKEFSGCSAAEWERVQQQTKRRPERLHYGAVYFPETVWIREASILENPAYDRKVFEARRRTMDKTAFAEQYLGKMTWKTGRIYSEFNEDYHVVPRGELTHEMIRNMRLGVGIDTGAYFGAVLVGITKDNKKWAFGEVYTQQQTIEESCSQVIDMVVRELGPAFGIKPDQINLNDEDAWFGAFQRLTEAIDHWYIDPASQHKIDINDRLDIAVAAQKMELEWSINEVRELFKHDNLIVTDNLTYAVDQLRKYVWKQVKAAGSKGFRGPVIKEPKKEYDHLLDALRFILVPLKDVGPREDPPPIITMAEAWERHRKLRVHGPLKAILERAEREGGVWI